MHRSWDSEAWMVYDSAVLEAVLIACVSMVLPVQVSGLRREQ